MFRVVVKLVPAAARYALVGIVAEQKEAREGDRIVEVVAVFLEQLSIPNRIRTEPTYYSDLEDNRVI